MRTTKNIIALAACALVLHTYGQSDTTNSIDGEYFIHGVFNPTLADADKIDLKPATYDTIIPIGPVKYTELELKGDVPTTVDSITAARLNIINPIEKLYQGYIKGGFGLFTTPLMEFYYDQGRSRENNYGIHVKHLSSNGGINDVGESKYSDNKVDLFYNHILDHHKLGGAVLYDRRRVSYYGFNPVISDSLLNINPDLSIGGKRLYNDIGFRGSIQSTFEDSSKISHNAGIEAHFFSSNSESTETSFNFDLGVRTTKDKETYSGDLLVDWIGYTGAALGQIQEENLGGVIIGVKPLVSTRGKNYEVQVGAGIYVDGTRSTTFHFYPRAYAHYQLFEDILIPYVGIDGERQRNSFRSLSRENPWITQAPNLVNTSKKLDVHGGLRGSVSSNIGFDIRVSSQSYADKALFVAENLYSTGEQFQVVYDDINMVDVSGELYVNSGNGLTMAGRIDIFTYNTTEQAEAWNMPPYALSARVGYDYMDKLLLKAEARIMGKRPALTIDAPVLTNAAGLEQVDMPGFLDLYIGAEYRYTNRFSVWFNVSNLSASKYERWSSYPIQRGLVMGGASYSF